VLHAQQFATPETDRGTRRDVDELASNSAREKYFLNQFTVGSSRDARRTGIAAQASRRSRKAE
jgi:hypothetical protein